MFGEMLTFDVEECLVKSTLDVEESFGKPSFDVAECLVKSTLNVKRLKHNQGGHFSKSMLYVNTLLVLTPIIILLSELNSKFQMLSSDI